MARFGRFNRRPQIRENGLTSNQDGIVPNRSADARRGDLPETIGQPATG